MFAVVFTYSFDSDCAVYLFKTREAAAMFMRESYEEELRIDNEENEWDTEAEIHENEGWAKITNHFDDRDDVTEYHLGQVYNKEE